jgi:pimeloyl-ACP methyl ester carboxylesterase
MLLELVDGFQNFVLWLRGFRSRHVDTSVGKVHVLDAPGTGDGPPVVILHGISASSSAFWTVLPALRAHSKRIIAPDMPGHGRSPVPSAGLTPETLHAGLVEALDAVIDEPVVFFGNSLGGAGAVKFALARPQHVRALILCSPGGASQDESTFRAFLQSFAMPDYPSAVAFVDKIHARPPFYRKLIASGVQAKFHAPAMKAFLARLSPADLLKADELRSLRAPVLLIWGKRDTLMPRDMLAFYREHLPSGTAVDEPDDMGHCPNLDAPDALSSRIIAFVRRIATEPNP